MEYIQHKPDNLSMYIDEFHTSIKAEFEKSIGKIYREEINVYKDVVETIAQLPFIQRIINENKILKARLADLEDANNGVKLEITDKPVSKNILDIEKIPFYKEEDESDSDSDSDSEESEAETESEDEVEVEESKDAESKVVYLSLQNGQGNDRNDENRRATSVSGRRDHYAYISQ